MIDLSDGGIKRYDKYVLHACIDCGAKGTIRQDETHYPDRCGLCAFEALKAGGGE